MHLFNKAILWNLYKNGKNFHGFNQKSDASCTVSVSMGVDQSEHEFLYEL